MRVKVIDVEHEQDLENEINDFLENIDDLIDIKYSNSHFFDGREQIYSFSAIIIYK